MTDRPVKASAPVRVCDVAVVGGGIAGLALAAALADTRLRVCVLEARGLPPAFADGGLASYDSRVSALTPRSIAFLRELGAWDRVSAWRHCPYGHMTVWDGEGTGRIEFDAAEVAAADLGSIVENGLVVRALADSLQGVGNVSLCLNAALASLTEHEGAVELVLEDGSAIEAKLVVAADGALSRARDLLGLGTREWDYGHRAIVTTAVFERSHRHTAWQRFLQSGPLALLPLGGGDERTCSIVWSIEEALADDLLERDDAGFAEALTQASEAVLGRVTDCAPRYGFPLRQRHAVDYVKPRAALVGDAAHTIHPLAGQGINLGLADVAVLAEELRRAVDLGLEPGSIAVLNRYQRRRKGDNLRMMAAMDGFKRLFGSDALPLRWLRNTGMRGVASLPAVKRRIIREAMGVV
ncbi:MAG: UbiH/UbiF/VisC/COQ6 family ubiquinone biosynthesis hydroxylase [Halieaceae bacterium]|jgi:2-octaprenylphenol hydroxylase|nr:UbiH/UbiF/VisC/COQ6 family ubiquinone biosynthesis hydroxylase [Halieaceae bacterium]